MSDQPSKLLTPILIKDREDMPWPEGEAVFYVLSRDGLFLCRQNGLFRSCVPVDRWPSELASQDQFLEHAYPKVPAGVFARLVGFFGAMAESQGCEAGAYLVYDRETQEVSALVPTQRATMSKGWNGKLHPIGLEYDNPKQMGSTEMILGTVHSHVFASAYSSGVDVHDEVEKPGVHIVVGCLHRDPPDLHAEAVVDGNRFKLEPMEVIEEYTGRDDAFPEEWLDRVELVVQPSWGSSSYGTGSASNGNSSTYYTGYGSYGTGYRYENGYGETDGEGRYRR